MGGFFVGNISGITRLQIDGDNVSLPMFDEQIKKAAFDDFFPVNAEKNVGFVSANDCLDANFTTETTLLGDYRVFSLRVDRRTVPASAMKIRVLEETKKYLQESGQKRLNKEMREQIKEAVRTELLKNIPPVTAIHDVAINTVTGVVYVSFLTNKLIQEFADIFKESFEGQIKLFEQMVKNDDLEKAGLSLVTVGREFMTWLWFKSQQGNGKIAVNGEDYDVHFIRRISLESGEGEMAGTVVCSGADFDLNEAKEALRQGKKVKNARIRIEKDDMVWEFGYKVDSFQFQSVKLPVSAEVGENETPEGRNLERLFMVSALMDVMDGFFKTFLQLRLSTEWADELSAIRCWADEG